MFLKVLIYVIYPKQILDNQPDRRPGQPLMRLPDKWGHDDDDDDDDEEEEEEEEEEEC